MILLNILIVTSIIIQTLAYYPYQPTKEEKLSDLMVQPMKKSGNGGGSNGNGGKVKMNGDSFDASDQQMMQAPVIRILNMKSQVNKDGTYLYMYETENGISMQEMGYVKEGPPSMKNGDKHGEDEVKPEYIQVAQGSYSYTSPEGLQINVNYMADENGFQTFDDNEMQDENGGDTMQMPMKQPANGSRKGMSNGGEKHEQQQLHRQNGGKLQMRPAPTKVPGKPIMMKEPEKSQWGPEAAYSSPDKQYQYSFEAADIQEETDDNDNEATAQYFGQFFKH